MKYRALLFSIIFLVSACTYQTGGKNAERSNANIQYGKIVSKISMDKSPSDGVAAGYHQIPSLDSKVVTKQEIRDNVTAVAPNSRHVYTVELSDGKRIKLTTEKDFFELRDCVAVERMELINLRLVDDAWCREERKAQVAHQQNRLKANQCLLAKKQLAIAQSDRQLETANEQVTNLCQFSRD